MKALSEEGIVKRQFLNLLLIALLFLPVLACGNGDEPTPAPVIIEVTPPPDQPAPTPTPEAPPPTEPATGIEVKEVTFAHGLTEEMQPVDPGSDFGPTETIYLSVRLKGRPKEGVVAARFYWRDNAIAEAEVDLGDVNSGLIFSIGEDTYVGYTLTHENPFPVSEGYRAEVFYNGEALGTYDFRVVPPAEAIPTQITSVTLAKGADENYDPVEPATTFTNAEGVYLVGHGDLGIATWLQAEWYVNGQLDEAGTRNLSLDENAADVGFAFSYLPEGGWPAGEHFVVLTVNGEEIGRYAFTTTE
jgi:hypothetical protein